MICPSGLTSGMPSFSLSVTSHCRLQSWHQAADASGSRWSERGTAGRLTAWRAGLFGFHTEL